MLGVPLPTRLSHARNHPLVCQLAETDAADSEFPIHRPRPPAQTAAVYPAGGVFGRAACLGDLSARIARLPWPDAKCKDITDLWRAGIDLTSWVVASIGPQDDARRGWLVHHLATLWDSAGDETTQGWRLWRALLTEYEGWGKAGYFGQAKLEIAGKRYQCQAQMVAICDGLALSVAGGKRVNGSQIADSSGS